MPFAWTLEDRFAAADVRTVDDDLAVEASGTQQRGVEDVRTVRRGDQHDAGLHVEAVHLDEELVQRLLALVVTTAETGTAVTSDGVDLVDEHDGGGRRLRLLEQVAHARGTDTDEHLDEVRAGDGEERDTRFTGDGAREEGLARARGAEQQDALRDLRAHRLERAGSAR